jgi:hypothetical protein
MNEDGKDDGLRKAPPWVRSILAAQDVNISTDGSALERMRQALRTRHCAYRTEQSHLDRCRRFLALHSTLAP